MNKIKQRPDEIVFVLIQAQTCITGKLLDQPSPPPTNLSRYAAL